MRPEGMTYGDSPRVQRHRYRAPRRYSKCRKNSWYHDSAWTRLPCRSNSIRAWLAHLLMGSRAHGSRSNSSRTSPAAAVSMSETSSTSDHSISTWCQLGGRAQPRQQHSRVDLERLSQAQDVDQRHVALLRAPPGLCTTSPSRLAPRGPAGSIRALLASHGRGRRSPPSLDGAVGPVAPRESNVRGTIGLGIMSPLLS